MKHNKLTPGSDRTEEGQRANVMMDRPTTGTQRLFYSWFGFHGKVLEMKCSFFISKVPRGHIWTAKPRLYIDLQEETQLTWLAEVRSAHLGGSKSVIHASNCDKKVRRSSLDPRKCQVEKYISLWWNKNLPEKETTEQVQLCERGRWRGSDNRQISVKGGGVGRKRLAPLNKKTARKTQTRRSEESKPPWFRSSQTFEVAGYRIDSSKAQERWNIVFAGISNWGALKNIFQKELWIKQRQMSI